MINPYAAPTPKTNEDIISAIERQTRFLLGALAINAPRDKDGEEILKMLDAYTAGHTYIKLSLRK